MSNETETENLLQKVAQDLLVSYIPIIAFLVLLVLIGIPGNVTAAAYYVLKRKKTSIETFIMALAFVDLFVCGLNFVYIFELTVNISHYFTSKFVCKGTYFVFHCGICLSVMIVCAIAVDRFFKLYLPVERHFKCTTARTISLVLTFAAVLYSSRDFLTYDSFAVNITISDVTVEGRMCMNVRIEDLQWAVTASRVIDFCALSIAVLLLICAYTAIVYKLYTLRMRMNENTGFKNSHLNLQENPNTTPGSRSQGFQIHRSKPEFETNGAHSNHVISLEERRITLMMSSVSAALIVCFLPYCIVNVIKFQEERLEYELSAGYRFALILVLANSVNNPIIYCIFTPEYRQFIKSFFTRCFRRTTRGIYR